MRSFFRNLFKNLGPGIITGASDDDPSGIATYSQAGAAFGFGTLWVALLTTPLMIAVQEMCARIGIATGRGIIRNMRAQERRGVVLFVVGLVAVASTINIGADLGMMAASAQLLIPLPIWFLLVCFTFLTLGLEIFLSYKVYARYLKWLTLSLLSYVLVAFAVKVDWLGAIRATVLPSFSLTKDYLLIFIAFLGTTISPYLFFWQANEEVEEELMDGCISEKQCKPRSSDCRSIIGRMRTDVGVGMAYSNIISWFIVLTTATVLFSHGLRDIQTPAEAARVLAPLAGNLAFFLFTIGVVGVGLLGIPVLSGAVAYAVSEANHWTEGLSKKWYEAKAFYLVMSAATVIGLMINLLGINPIKGLIWSAVLNGVVAAPLIFFIIRLANNRKIMGRWANGRVSNILCWLAFALMAAASILWLLFSI